MPTFLDLQDDAALLSFEHQLHLSEVIGEHSWEVDLAAPRFAFTGDHPVTATAMHLLGSAAPGPRSWLWSWANPTGYRQEVIWLAESLRDFGKQHGIPQLSEPEVPFDDLPGSPTDPAQVASLMMEAAKAVSQRWSGYQGPVGGGTRVGMLIEHPDFLLPAPEGPRVTRVLQQGLMELRFHEHRRAVRSYARNRGLRLQENETQMLIEGPAFTATVEFDEYHRVSNMKFTMGPGAQPR
ncbi:DUF6882 domain-containing protein [Actinophytocola sp. NPDC049390]|uniref:DUF6882 domain-containing protein n=1 Tax=Actinophytocola sp. NPDC049390 TaxID=3363894 RepID=UPI003794901D